MLYFTAWFKIIELIHFLKKLSYHKFKQTAVVELLKMDKDLLAEFLSLDMPVAQFVKCHVQTWPGMSSQVSAVPLSTKIIASALKAAKSKNDDQQRNAIPLSPPLVKVEK